MLVTSFCSLLTIKITTKQITLTDTPFLEAPSIGWVTIDVNPPITPMPSPFKPAEKWEPLLLARDTRNESRDSWNLLSIEADHNPLAIDPVTCAFE